MNSIVTLFNTLFTLAATLGRTNEIVAEFNARAERSLGMQQEEVVLQIEHVDVPKRKSK